MTTGRESYEALSEYDRGVLAGLQLALAALDGHGFHDTAHDRVRRLLACSECHHAPEKHEDGGECREQVFTGRGPFVSCHCAEYEVAWLTLAKHRPGSPS